MRKAKGYWDNKENVFTEAKKYPTRYEFYKGCGSAYYKAWKNGWLSEMDWFKEVYKHWNYEKCYEIAKKYPTRNKFKQNAHRAYDAARKNKWLDILFPKKVA